MKRGNGLTTRKPLTRRGGLTARTPMTRSKWVPQTNPATVIPADVSALLVARSGGWCEPMVHGECTGVARERHHRKRRRDGGHAVTNLLHCCPECHRWITEHPAYSRMPGVGWIVSAFDDAETADVLLHQSGPDTRIVRLAADGTYQ